MAHTGDRSGEHANFWEVAEPFLATGRLYEGTMMGHQCLRTSGNDQFVATVERSSGNLVVKLPKERVADLVEAGDGLAFAPAGKVFREWVAVPDFDETRWTSLIDESIAFVGG